MIRRVGRWLRVALLRRRFEARMAAEMAEHLAFRVDELAERGVPRHEAERRARLELGGSVESFKEECREARKLAWFDELARNLRHSLRVLRRSPGLSLSIALTLGLCLGANTIVLSVIDAALLRPLPYPEPERLGLVRAVWEDGERGSTISSSHDGATWERLRDAVRGLDVAVYSGWPSGANAMVGEQAIYLRQQRVGARFFRVLAVEPALGRNFSAAEDVAGGPAVVLLGHALWARAFGSDPAVLGRTLLLRGVPHEIVGVMPAEFRTDTEADLWTPLQPSRRGEGSGSNYGIVARLRPTVTWAAARAELGALELEESSGADSPRVRLDVISLQEGLAGDLRHRLLVTWGAAFLLLAVGAINVAGLLLAHGARRAAEINTRLALGGGRAAVMRQLLTESFVFSTLGGLVGLALGGAGLYALRDFARTVLGVWQPIELDGQVLLSVCVLVLFTVIATGLYPALLSTRAQAQPPGHAGGARVAGVRNPWPRRLLVGGQLALVVTLMIGAGLILRSWSHLRGLAPGCDLEGVVAGTLSLQDARYETPESLPRLFGTLVEELHRQPSVEGAAAGLSLPFERPLNMGFTFAEEPDSSRTHITNLTYITPGYFETLRAPLLAGRTIGREDRADSVPVVVVNQAFARAYLENRAAIGARIRVAGTSREIVGVVGDLQQRPSWGDPAPLASSPGVFLPVTQVSADFLKLVHTWFEPSFFVRARGNPAATGTALREALARVDPGLPLAEVRGLEAVRDRVLAPERFQTLLLALTALVALALAAVGLAGLIAGSVTERTRELGIRMSLGASSARTLAQATLPGLGIAFGGLTLGLGIALALVPTLRAFVFGVEMLDPLTLASVSLVLLAVAAIASLLPALRLLRLDLARTLRAS